VISRDVARAATIRELAHYTGTDYDFQEVGGCFQCLLQFTYLTGSMGWTFHHSRAFREAGTCVAARRHARRSQLGHRAVEDHRSPDQSTAHGAVRPDAFDLVIPSLPGHRFFLRQSRPRPLDPIPHRRRGSC